MPPGSYHARFYDMAFSHARIPGPEHHFLINPYGLNYNEVTATNLATGGINIASNRLTVNIRASWR